MKKLNLKNLIFTNSELSTNHNLQAINKFVTISDNNVMLNKTKERKPNELIGSYKLININNRLHLKLNKNLFNFAGFRDEYVSSLKVLIENNIDIINERYDNIIFINNLILKKEYRGKGVFEEFVKHIYRTYFNSSTLIVFLIAPIQEYKNLFFLYRVMFKVTIRDSLKSLTLKEIPMDEYYQLKDFDGNYDLEDVKLKLYSLAQKSGLDMYNVEGLFYINETRILKKFNDSEAFV